MRYGRKSRSQRINGFKRHSVHDLDRDLVRAVGVTSANVPEATVTADLDPDLAAQHVTLAELHLVGTPLTWPRTISPALHRGARLWFADPQMRAAKAINGTS